MDDSFYTGILYPFQDEVLRVIDESETEFCLSGGTAAGIFPADLARVLCSVNRADHDLIRWQNDPGFEQFRDGLNDLSESLILV